MTTSLFISILQTLSSRWPLLVYAAAWTTLLTLFAAVASLSPEIAFVAAISPDSSFARGCHHQKDGLVRVPFDLSGEVFCFPAHMIKRSKMDLVVPPIFAALIVGASAYLVRALGLWEVDVETL